MNIVLIKTTKKIDKNKQNQKLCVNPLCFVGKYLKNKYKTKNPIGRNIIEFILSIKSIVIKTAKIKDI